MDPVQINKMARKQVRGITKMSDTELDYQLVNINDQLKKLEDRKTVLHQKKLAMISEMRNRRG